MKTWVTISALLNFAFVQAQTIDRFVVSSGGASIQINGYSADITLGEIIGNYFGSTDFIITPGFQQGSINKKSVGIVLTGLIADNKTILTWSLPFEKNSSLFYIQKQNDTLNSFHEIDSVNTQAPGGNSKLPTSYIFADNYPIQGVSGYRIKLLQKDGSVTYSNSIHIIYKGALWWLTSLYPNPTRSIAYVKVFAREPVFASYIICDADGKIFYTGTQNLDKGSSEIQLPVSKLANGTYFFKLYSRGKVAPDLVARFLKLPGADQ